jgi:hypothetical protein
VFIGQRHEGQSRGVQRRLSRAPVLARGQRWIRRWCS